MRGYWSRPDLTAGALAPDTFGASSGVRLYKTGDLVRFRRDGNLEFVGRIDQQVKWHGFRIELGEIEAALARHTDIRAAAALVREDVPGRKQLVAYCVPRSMPGPPAGELRRFLGGLLPPYMVPSAFVTLPDCRGRLTGKRIGAPCRRRT